ncbi:MAG: ROK family transcriptional regulator [Devosia sp.]
MVVENGRTKSYFDALARGMQPTVVRQSNQRAVLTVISVEHGQSNAELARRTGLAPQTVSAVLTDLDQGGLLVRGAVRRRGGRGQPATPIDLNPDGAYAVGAEIGWEHMEVALVDFTGRVIGTERRSYRFPDANRVFGDLADMTAAVLGPLSAASRGRVIGLGLAAPGGIGDTSSLLPPPPGQSALWAEIDMLREAEAATGLHGQLFNDGNAACWAEFVSHPSPRPGDFAYLLIDTFVGAGIIAEDRLWEGVTGASANLGSMLVSDRRGTPRFVHQIASLFALNQRLEAAGTTLAEATRHSPQAEAQFTLSEWIEDASFALAQTVLNAATVIEFDFAIIEAALPERIRIRLVEAVSRRVLDVPSLGRNRPSVRLGHLGRSGAAQGAALLRLYRRFFSRELAHLDVD